MSCLSGIMEPENIEIIFDLKKTLFNKIFWRALKRFVETLRGNLINDLNLNWFDWVMAIL